MALTKIKADGLTADLIDETKLADNSIDSEHYNDGSIDNAHLADDAVGVAELSATGTASSSTFLRGDNTWATVTSTTINNNADNRVITGSGTANTLEGESTFTYDNGGLNIAGNSSRDGLKITQAGSHYGELCFNSNRTGENQAIGYIRGEWDGTEVGAISIEAGDDTTNKDDAKITFYTAEGGTISRKMAIEQDGNVHLDNGNLNIGTTGKGLEFQNSVTIKEGSSNLNINVGAGNNNIDFQSGGTAFLKLRGTNGNVEVVSGNVEIGTAGKGIHFHNYGTGTNIDSNLLDDYEEGTFTPVFNSSSGGHDITYSTNVGNYTKVGNAVSIEMYLNINTINANGSGHLRIGGLPFTKTGRYGGVYIDYVHGWNGVKLSHALIDHSSTQIYLYQWNTSSSSNYYSNTLTVAGALTNSGEVIISGTYFTS